MSKIFKEYAKNKQVEIDKKDTDYEIVMKCLIKEYGFIAPVFKDTDTAEIIEIGMDDKNFALHKRYLETVEPIEPVEPEIIGIVVKSGNRYRLIDGHHRFKWASKYREKASFIFIH